MDQPAEYGIIILGTGKFIKLQVILCEKVLNIIHFTRSTPRVDSFWGGKNDLIAASGFEKDGVTTIAFRKKLIGD